MTELAIALVLGLVAAVVAGIACRARGLEPGERLNRWYRVVHGRERRN